MIAGIDTLVHLRTAGKTLPRPFYTGQAVFDADLRQVFYRHWLFAGHSCEVREPGDFVTVAVGNESLVIVRDKSGELHAHFNVCRHRGSRIVHEACGHVRALICPYHQWVYALDGHLTNARLMGDGFDASAYRLRSAHVRELAGLLFVSLAPEPPDFDPFVAAIEPQIRPHRLDRTKVIGRDHYEVQANWKIVVENNRECYHCRVAHPEFCMSNYDLGLPGDLRHDGGFDETLERAYAQWRSLGLAPQDVSFPAGAPYRVVRFPLKDGYLTESTDGGLVAPLLGDLTTPHTGSLRLITLPNLWAHVNCDYAMTTRLTPLGPGRTRLDVSFLVRDDAVEGVDYDPQRVAAVWRATSEQDWALCESSQAGIASLAYEPGPYSPLTESSVEMFVCWYLDQLRAP